VIGSSVHVAKIIPDMKRNATPTSARPSSDPIDTTRRPSRATNRSTAAAGAPTAIRIAISLVRWEVTNEMDPYSPTVASDSTRAAMMSAIRVMRSRGPVLASRRVVRRTNARSLERLDNTGRSRSTTRSDG
jgi:hypothetical protein